MRIVEELVEIWLNEVCDTVGAGDRDTRGDGTGGGGVFGIGEERGLATSYVSCCSCMVRAAKVVLILFSETFCLFISLWRWCCRYPKASATFWGVSRGNNIWRTEFLRRLGITGRATY